MFDWLQDTDWAVSRAPGCLDVFKVDAGGTILHAAWDEAVDETGAWRGWWPVPGSKLPSEGRVCALSHGPDALELFFGVGQGPVLALFWDESTGGGTWKGPVPIPGALPSEAGAVRIVTGLSRAPGTLDIFTVVSTDDSVYTTGWDIQQDGIGKWSRPWSKIWGDQEQPWSKIDQEQHVEFAAVSSGPDRMDVIQGIGPARRSTWTGGSWQPWVTFAGDTELAGEGPPSAVSRTASSIDIFWLSLEYTTFEEGAPWKGIFFEDGAVANSQPVKAVASGPSQSHVFIYGELKTGNVPGLCHGLRIASDTTDPSGSGTWAWEIISSPANDQPKFTAVSRKTNVVDVFRFGDFGAVFTATRDGDSPVPWSPWREIVTKTVPAPEVTLDTTALDFGSQPVLTTSSPLPITLTNAGNDTLHINLAVIDDSSASFLLEPAAPSPNKTELSPGDAVQFLVSFRPQKAANITGALLVFDNAPDSPQRVALKGLGAALSPNPPDAGDPSPLPKPPPEAFWFIAALAFVINIFVVDRRRIRVLSALCAACALTAGLMARAQKTRRTATPRAEKGTARLNIHGATARH